MIAKLNHFTQSFATSSLAMVSKWTVWRLEHVSESVTFVGAVCDAERSRASVHRSESKVLRNASATVDLNRTIDDAECNTRCSDFDHGNLCETNQRESDAKQKPFFATLFPTVSIK